MLLDADECQLVLVDYQTRLMPAIADSALVLANAVRLAQMAQADQALYAAKHQGRNRVATAAVAPEPRTLPAKP